MIGSAGAPDGECAGTEPVNVDCGAEEEERRPAATHVVRPVEDNSVLQRFSSLSGLLRVTALCFSFRHNSRHPLEKRTGFITRDELESARLRWIRIAQRMDFQDEMTRLEQRKPLAARSPLLPLRPFLDDRGLLRLGGRLQHALLPFDEKHPLILTKTNHLSLLLVRDAHMASLHGGPQLTRSLLLRRV